MIRKLCLALLCLFLFAAPSARAVVYYVDGSKPNNNGNGQSWVNAKKDVQEAINVATATGDQVWVKAGTYLPTLLPAGPNQALTARDKAFYLFYTDLKLYGGFTGIETQLSQRNAVTNVTTLSGDLDGPGGTNDAYHVMILFERTTACVIDGFTISGGFANSTSPSSTDYFPNGVITGFRASYSPGSGGGIYNENSSPTITNCIISNNVAATSGAGILNQSSNPSVSNCTFSSNIGDGMTNEGYGNLTVSGCTFSNNTGLGMYNSNSGASASNTSQGSLTVSNCTFSNNGGGGLFNYISNLTITDCIFSNNGAGAGSNSGGGLKCYSGGTMYVGPTYLTITNCAFNNNVASGTGGALDLGRNTTATVSNCTFNANTAGFYGGGVNIDGTNNNFVLDNSFSNCTFLNNTAYAGGGIYNNRSGLSVSGSSFSGNTAAYGNSNPPGLNGGGICNLVFSNLSVSNSTFSGNTADGSGGGIYNDTYSPAISSCTFSGNAAVQGGGGLYTASSPGLGCIITNCILTGNTSGIATQQDVVNFGISSSPVAITYSLIGASNTNYNPGVGVITGNPAFVNAANPAGPDGIFRTIDDGLRIGCISAARDAGTGTTPPTDILGNPRVGVKDIGAYENPGTGCTNLIQYVDVAMPANGNGYSWSSAKRDLQEAIDSVAAGGEVWVKQGTYLPTRDPNGNATPTDTRDKNFHLTTKDVKLFGGFTGTETQLSQRNAVTNLTTLSGDLDGINGTADAYHVLLIKGRTTASLVDGFTIKGGRANGSGTFSVSGTLFSQADGGGITNNGSSLTISNCIIANNMANAYAGGMCNMASSPTVRGCIFSNNSGDIGGAMSNASSSSPVISSSTLSANTAISDAGGIYYANNSGGSITNTILSGNTGGLLNYQNILKDGPLVPLSVSNSVVGDYSPAATNNYTASNILSGDPLVAANNPAGADGRLGTADDGLRIGCSSQARDAGTGSTPTTDILGNPRVGNIDIGAYEFQGTTCPTQMYVNGSRADNSGTGTSWATAKKDIQAAVNEVTADGEVWVKSGTYLPTLDPNGNATPADARDKTFYLTTKDVKLYGGFNGTETQLSARNPVTNVTTMSGDLDGINGTSDAYHVFITKARTTACVVDGFTITSGWANGSGTTSFSGTTFDRSRAGGMYNNNGSLTIANCTFSNNTAGTLGGGMYNTTANPNISACTFINNTASQNGGGIFNDNSSPSISSSTFSTNIATISGGGLYNLNSVSLAISSCTFNGNTAYGNGGGMLNENSSPSITNCTFSINAASTGGGGLYNLNSSSPVIITCIFSGNTSGSNGGGIRNLNSNPVISSSTFSSNTASISGGGIYSDNNSGGSITNTIVSGSTGGPNNRQNIYKDAGSILTVSNSVIGDYSSTATNNYTATNILSGDPFVAANNPAGADGRLGTADDGLRISCSSQARDAGTGTMPANDILGNSRVGALDIGAYEYQGTTCPTQMYVNGNRPDNSGTGTSWATAKKDIQAAINEVAAGGAVWVGSGTYLPTLDPNGSATPTDARDKTFYLTTKDVRVYGGFAGTESLLSQRNISTNLTILSGDLDGVNGTADAYHVVVTGGRTIACWVDGFTITGGRANGSGTVSFSGNAFERAKAGGMYNLNSSPSINNCSVSSNTAFSNGGGIYDQGGSPIVSGSTFSNNTAGSGGGIYNATSNPTMSGCTFINNTAIQNGGGLLNDNSSPQISSCTFSSNLANTSGGALHNLYSNSSISNCTFNTNMATVYGGGIYNEGGNPVISSCTFTSNTTSARGGGLYNLNSNPSISSSTFSTNTAAVFGGGMYNEGGNPVLTSCAFGSNSATQNGGGMYNSLVSPVLISCIFSTNTAGANGGGISNENSSPSISSSTFSANIATVNGGGVYGDNNSGGSITNSILSGNTGGPANRQNIYKDAGTGTLTVSYSVVGDYSSTATNNYTASNILAGDPLFVNAASPAGADGIFRTADDGLRITSCTSPARNAGIGTTPATDMLGNARLGTIDIGAYENINPSCPKTLYIDGGRSNNNGDGLTWSTAKKDLQAGINAAVAGDDIWVKAGIYLPTLDPNGNTPANVRDKTFYMTGKDVKLYGGFAGMETLLSQRNVVTNLTTLSGDLDGPGGTNDAYHVLITGTRTVACVVDGFTITGGRADSNSNIAFTGITSFRNLGGGMYNSSGSPTIRNCIIRNNGASDDGGGMYNATSSPQIISCTFSTNTAGVRGGGLENAGGLPSLNSCTFNSNTAGLNGGGLASINNSNISVSNCIFSFNTANNNGGGLSNGVSSNLSITNCTFSANTASANGGGLANVNFGILSMTNCTFSGNKATTNGGGLFNSSNSRGSVTNCILSANLGGPINRQNIFKDTGTTVLTVSYTLINDYSSTATNNYTASNILRDDPLFADGANPAGADGKLGTADDGLALRSCSPAVNSGTTTSPALAQDILNNNRVGAYDLGSYEYQSAATVPALSVSTTTATAMEYLGGVLSFGDCNNAIATLRSQGNKPISGTVAAKVYVQSATPMQGQIPYVRRHYDITPAIGADTATAQVTLYFTQADFDDYNTSRGNRPPLPLDTADAAGNKANIRISQEHGNSASGLPGSYTGWGGAGPAAILFTPQSVVRNASASRWEVTFPVTGFSGFFLQSGLAVPLPVTLLAFGAKQINASLNRVEWKTAHEDPGTMFTVERSGDAKTFKSLGTVAGRGIFTGSEYQFDDVAPLEGNNYYRLKNQEPNGKESFSQTVLVRSEGMQNAVVTVFPNPASDWVTIRSTDGLLGSKAILVDMNGRVMKELVVAKVTVLDIHQLAAGVYVLRLVDGSSLRIVRK